LSFLENRRLRNFTTNRPDFLTGRLLEGAGAESGGRREKAGFPVSGTLENLSPAGIRPAGQVIC
jgi:hypothetical protein